MINDEIPFDLLDTDGDVDSISHDLVSHNSVSHSNKNKKSSKNDVSSNGHNSIGKQERIVYFKTTNDLLSLVGNIYIHSVYNGEGIFGMKCRGYISLSYIKEHFGLTNLKQSEKFKDKLDFVKCDFINENSREFIMLDKTTPYIKSVELINGFLDFVMLKQGKMRSDFYTLEEIKKITEKINRHFEPYEAKDFVNRLLDLANISGADRLMLLQDNPRNKHSSSLPQLKKSLKHWGYDIDLPIYILNGKGVPTIDNIQLVQWLNLHGFFIHFVNPSDAILVRVIENKATPISNDKLINWISEKLKYGDSFSYAAFMNCPQKAIINSVLKTMPVIESIGLKDTRTEAYKAFANGICKITKHEIKLIPYKEIDFVVWQSEILNHHLNLAVADDVVDNSKFARFFKAAVQIENTYLFGYLSHRYKDPALTKIVVFTDFNPTEKEDEANGRCGKSILINALSHFNKVVEIDDLGKGRFDLQNVELYHGIIAFPDAPHSFNIRALFNATTGTMTIERKSEKSILIPFKESPKIVVATNHTLKITTDSYLDRLAILHFTDFFNIHNRPVNYLGGMLFEDEWNEFYIFCLRAVKDWLNIYSFSGIKKNHLDKLSWIQAGVVVTRGELDSKLKNIPPETYKDYLKMKNLREILKRGGRGSKSRVDVDNSSIEEDDIFLSREDKILDKKTIKITWELKN